MKHLCDYIFEGMPMGNFGVDFDTFCDYALDTSSENPAREKVKQILFKTFGWKTDDIIEILERWVDDTILEISKFDVPIDENILRFMYEKFASTPAQKLDKLIGHGYNGVVIDLGDKVMKCFYKGELWQWEKKFYELCQKNKFDVFPKVYRIGNGYVVMEKLKTYTIRCERLFDILDSIKDGDKTVFDIIKDNETDNYKWSKKEQAVLDWMSKVKEGLETIGVTDYGDLQLCNVGERQNKEIVYFDI